MAESTDDVKEDATFESLGLRPELCEACKTLGYKKPTAIQIEAIPAALAGNDVIALAETGSGKTAAFALPVLESLMNEPAGLYACVLTPTRELAIQIKEQFEALGAVINVRATVLVGGVSIMEQAFELAKKPHIVIATPGRLVQHLHTTKGFTLSKMKFFIMDEADRLLSFDFEEEVNTLLRVLPRTRRTFMFSATMSKKLEKLQRASLQNPVKIKVSSKYQTVEGLTQNYLFIPFKQKECYVAYLCNEMAGSSIIIFTGTCVTSQRLALALHHLSFGAVPLHGQMDQRKRNAALSKFKTGAKNILVCTDVASRGIDIVGVDLVINFDLPSNSKDYVHRVGRTARAGKLGRAISLVSQYDVELYQRIEQMLGQKLEKYDCDEAAVLVMQETVSEALRIAKEQLGDAKEAKPKSADNDTEEANEMGMIMPTKKFRSKNYTGKPIKRGPPGGGEKREFKGGRGGGGKKARHH